MRIINLTQFLAMPENTLFTKYDPRGNFGSMGIKTGNAPPIDFYYKELVEVESTGSDNWSDIMEEAEKTGERVELDDYCQSRDGLYREDQLYAVFGESEVRAFIKMLQTCLPKQHST